MTCSPRATGGPVAGDDRHEPAPEPGTAKQMHAHPTAFESKSSAHPQAKPGEAKAAPDRRSFNLLMTQTQPQGLGRPHSESVLVKQLRCYWQLAEPETDSSSPPDTPGMEGRSRPDPSWPLPALNPSPTRTWPDLIDQMAARKITHLQHHAHSSGEQSQQTVHADSPENVEIRNVFNIALPGHSDRHHQADTQLAETIADILREQALQHGIDIT
jgi:hypothetical protein